MLPAVLFHVLLLLLSLSILGAELNLSYLSKFWGPPQISTEGKEDIKKSRERLAEIAIYESRLLKICEDTESFLINLGVFEEAIEKSVELLNVSLAEVGIGKTIPQINFKTQKESIEKVNEEINKKLELGNEEIKVIESKLEKIDGFAESQSKLTIDIEDLRKQIRETDDNIRVLIEKKGRTITLNKEADDIFIKRIGLYFEWKMLYEEVIDVFSKGKSEILSGLDFKSNIYSDCDGFVMTGDDILHGRQVSITEIEDIGGELKKITNIGDANEREKQINTYLRLAKINREYLKTSRNLLDFCNWIYKDYHSLTTKIYFESIEKEKLSLGQKGTILLKLYLAEGDYPLLADMPEENLDNQFIYKELVGAIRQAKQNRQIIIATNNANLVVNTDAEQIIVAEYKDNCISYTSGAIENYEIRESLKLILEGGEEALIKREKKYGL